MWIENLSPRQYRLIKAILIAQGGGVDALGPHFCNNGLAWGSDNARNEAFLHLLRATSDGHFDGYPPYDSSMIADELLATLGN
jgi:hypothetical protein